MFRVNASAGNPSGLVENIAALSGSEVAVALKSKLFPDCNDRLSISIFMLLSSP